MPYTIGIVGAGIGGLTAAALLARDGHRVSVFEKSERLEPVGAGLLIQPTGQAVLRDLGLDERAGVLAHRIRSLQGKTPSGRRVLSLDYSDLRAGVSGLGMHRAALHSLLLDAAREHGAEVRPGLSVTGVDAAEYLRFIRARDASGAETREGPFDLVIVADGARSSLRSYAGPVKRAEPYAWGVLWGVIETPPRGFGGVLRQVYDGTRTMLGFLPSGRISADGPETLCVFWSVRCADWAGPASFDFDGWRRRVAALTPDAGDVVDQIPGPEQLIYAPYTDVKVEQRDTHVLALGDASHAMSPQLGQGANLAMLDAFSLSQRLREHASLKTAIRAHVSARRAQTAYYRRVTRALTPFFQSDLAPLGWARDLLLGPACAMPLAKGMMLRTLAGIKTGVLRSGPLP